MLDTVVLTLEESKFRITDHNRFEPSTVGLFNGSYGFGGKGYLVCKQNPTKLEMVQCYKPRLSVTKRFREIMLKIEFSAAKLIFENNFDELEESDFSNVVITLCQRLEEMGVLVSLENLRNAPVSAIHYSKNMELLDGLTPYSILKEIQKSNISQRLDFDQCDFQNEGHAVKFRVSSYEITFYDKVKDLQQARISPKRGMEKDYASQLALYNDIQEERKKRPVEILRMEVRLNRREKIRATLSNINKLVELTFQNLFNKEISQKVLLHYLDEVESHYPKPLNYRAKSAKDFVSQFIIDNPKTAMKEIFMALGYYRTMEEIGSRETRAMLGKYPKISWYRLHRQMESYNYTKSNSSPFEVIRKSINEFKPLRKSDFDRK